MYGGIFITFAEDMKMAAKDGTLEKLEKRIDIVLELLPGSEILKPDMLNILEVYFSCFINSHAPFLCTLDSIPDDAFYNDLKGLKQAIRSMLETGEVMTVTVGERALKVQRYNGEWQIGEPNGPFQKVLRCLLPPIKEIEKKGFTVGIVFQKPVKVIVGGLEFGFVDLVK